MAENILTQDMVKQLFEYEPETGSLIRKVAAANQTKAGQTVGTLRSDGYLKVQVNRKGWKVHRIIFLLHHGWLPREVDHINGNKTDNRIENLRAATTQQNQQNCGMSARNTSGYKGVSFNCQSKKWQAAARAIISGQRKKLALGTYETPEAAAEAYQRYAQRSHGEFYFSGVRATNRG